MKQEKLSSIASGSAPSPKKRNAELTKEKILTAATAEFAKHGFDGARVDAIADKARVNKQMLYHYFRSKDGLFTEVLEREYRSIRRSEAELALEDLPADKAILAIVEFTWRYYIDNPHFIRLLNSENQNKARHLKASPNTHAINAGHRDLMARLIERGRSEGTVRPDLDPFHLSINISALGFFYLMNRHTLSTVFERDLENERTLSERLKVMKDIIARWIHPHS